MSRAAWKLPYVHRLFLSSRLQQGKYFTLWLRNSVISPYFLNKAFSIYNGKQMISVTITQDMIGRKFGEFSLSKALGYRQTKKNSKKKGKRK